MAAALLTVIACDQDWPTDPGTDTSITPDVTDDTTIVPDVGDDTTPPDTAPDVPEDTTPACTYPTGTYNFSRVGDLVPPSSWPSAVLASDETAPADLETAFCDPDIQSIFVFLATPT